jgi:hypothetical protein
MRERNGIRLGQRVRDLDGNELGKVTGLHDWAFRVSKGFSLFRRDVVARYDEVRGERDGALVLARSARDLDVLAAGGIPPAWRIPAPPEFPAAATPAEARLVFESLAARAAPPRGDGAAPVPQPAADVTIRREDERAYVESRGQAGAGAPAAPPPGA